MPAAHGEAWLPQRVLRYRRIVRRHLSVHPSLYLPLRRLRDGTFVVRRDTELVIEGFPRSGNSFLEAAFRIAQDRGVRLSHHCHAAANVIAAVRLDVPVVVVFRKPDDAVASLVKKLGGIVTLADALKEYCTFYEAILPHRHRLVLASFESATGDLDRIVDRVNTRFGTTFRSATLSPDMVRKTYALLDRLTLERTGVARASYSPAARADDRAARLARLEQIRETLAAPQLAGLRNRAAQCYERLQQVADC